MVRINDTNKIEECNLSIRTCGELYKQWRSRGRVYKKAANQGGILMNIKYVDTGMLMDPIQRAQAPVVLAIHGAPGSYEDFDFIIEHFKTQNVRVIAPNFPGKYRLIKNFEFSRNLFFFVHNIQQYDWYEHIHWRVSVANDLASIMIGSIRVRVIAANLVIKDHRNHTTTTTATSFLLTWSEVVLLGLLVMLAFRCARSLRMGALAARRCGNILESLSVYNIQSR